MTKRTLIILWLLLTMALSVHALTDRQTIIVVHTGESKSLLYNPATSKEVRGEMPDGNVMLTVQPKDQK